MTKEVGAGRPDKKDEEIMLDFGRKAYEKILSGDYELHNQPVTNWSASEEANKIIAMREQSKDPYYFSERMARKENFR